MLIRILLTCVLAFCVLGPTSLRATFMIVAETGNVQDDGIGTVTIAGVNATGADGLLHAFWWYCGPGYEDASVSDENANGYTELTVQFEDVQDGCVQIAYDITTPTVDSSMTFTYTTGGGDFIGGACVVAVSGMDAFDDENGAVQGSTVEALSPGSVTPSANGALILTGLVTVSGTHTPGASYTSVFDNDVVGGVTMGGGCARFIQPSAGSINEAWEWMGVSEAAAVVAVFTTDAGGGAPACIGRIGLLGIVC